MATKRDIVLNCWDARACGKGPAAKPGEVCPAATETRLDGQNRGRNAGRSCWVVPGTLCDGAVQGSFATKLTTCSACTFFAQVAKDERPDAASPGDLLALLR